MAVYFIQNTTTRSIKIGCTDNLSHRLKSLQTASEHELVLLCSVSGGLALERLLHARLAAFRIRGEWFRSAPEVSQVIGELVTGELRLPGEMAGTPPVRRVRRDAARDWLIALFRERDAWSSSELFGLAREAGLSRCAIFEARDELGIPRPRKRTDDNGATAWIWWVPADWPHLSSKEVEL